MADDQSTNGGARNVGRILEIQGVVVDAVFPDELPEINTALKIVVPEREGRPAIELVAGDVRGLAVHVAARIMAIASPGEILVSGTVRDVLAGTDIGFGDRGIHELKGLSDPKHVFAVTA